MASLKTKWRVSGALFGVLAAGLATGQSAAPATPAGQNSGDTAAPAQTAPAAQAVAPARKTITLGELVEAMTQQEKRMNTLMRNFKPIVETYIQEEQPDAALGTTPKADDYF